jgi:hypothetical protein
VKPWCNFVFCQQTAKTAFKSVKAANPSYKPGSSKNAGYPNNFHHAEQQVSVPL